MKKCALMGGALFAKYVGKPLADTLGLILHLETHLRGMQIEEEHSYYKPWTRKYNAFPCEICGGTILKLHAFIEHLYNHVDDY